MPFSFCFSALRFYIFMFSSASGFDHRGFYTFGLGQHKVMLAAFKILIYSLAQV